MNGPARIAGSRCRRLKDATASAVRDDGTIWIASAQAASVRRFAASDGAYVDIFVAPGSGGLSNPRSLAFGPDGNCYVASTGTSQILRYDGRTGAFMGVF